MFPVRMSNKPPYIYWKKLVIIGLILLFVSLPIAILSTEITFKEIYADKGEITAQGKVPAGSLPVNVLASVSALVTNLSVKLSMNSENSLTCSLTNVRIYELTANGSVLLKPHIKGGIAYVSSWGPTLYKIQSPGNCTVMYEYVVYEVGKPYLYLSFISAIMSISGAAAGVLGVVLLFKQRQLMKQEEKYL